MKKGISLILILCMMLTLGLSGVSAAESVGYELIPNEADGFVVVINPNGGEKLSYSPNSGVTLLEDSADGYTYAFKDLNKNGTIDAYEDWRLTDEERAMDLAGRMEVSEIAGLMLFSSHTGPGEDGAVTEDQYNYLVNDNLRAVLYAQTASTTDVVKWNNNMQEIVETNDKYGIPVNYSSDPRNQSSTGSAYDGGVGDISLWPGNLGLAATFDAAYALAHGKVASSEYRALGITTALSPQIDLATEPRWSRVSGTFGESAALAKDMARAYVDGFQSSFDENGEDLGWESGSVNAMIKHWPGDGSGEAGRESHSNSGKYAVYPGQNMQEHIDVFVQGGMQLNGKTGVASAIMPSYSIGVDAYGTIGEGMGSGYSSYKLVDLLREMYAFQGVVCSDWGITSMTKWGVENLDVVYRHYLGLMNGLDMFGGNNDKQPILDAYEMGIKINTLAASEGNAFLNTPAVEAQDGKEVMDAIFNKIAYRVLLNEFRVSLFENPYLSVEESNATVGNEQYMKAGYDAQLASVVLLKNKGNVIAPLTEGARKTMYVPMIYTAATEDFYSPIDGKLLTSAQPGSWAAGLDVASAERYFNVVTDTLNADADPENPQATDYTRLASFDGVDFAFVSIASPVNAGSMFSGYGYDASSRNLDAEVGALNNGYYPLTLQYRTYTADPAIVREAPMAVDAAEDADWVLAGGERGMSRYYGGKQSVATNESDLDMVLSAVELADGKIPVIVGVRASNAMCFYEFEDKVDAIVMTFGVSDQAMLEVIAGVYEPQGLLPIQMPANMETVETQFEDVAFDLDCHVDSEGNTYDFAYGLNWSGKISDARTEKYAR